AGRRARGSASGAALQALARKPSAARRADRFHERLPPVARGAAARVRRPLQEVRIDMGRLTCVLACAAVLAAADARAQGLLQSADLLKLRSVTAVELSPNATR